MTHTVVPDEHGFFLVTSGNSGRAYRVVPLLGGGALCECEGFRHRGACSHVAAVEAFALQEVG